MMPSCQGILDQEHMCQYALLLAVLPLITGLSGVCQISLLSNYCLELNYCLQLLLQLIKVYLVGICFKNT